MESYILKKILFSDGDTTEIDVDNINEIRELTKGDAIIDKTDGYCRCYECDREFDLYDEKQANEFYSSHNHLFDVNDYEVYECDEYSCKCC